MRAKSAHPELSIVADKMEENRAHFPRHRANTDQVGVYGYPEMGAADLSSPLSR